LEEKCAVGEIVPGHRHLPVARRQGTLLLGDGPFSQRKTVVIMLIGRGFSPRNAIGIDFLSPEGVKSARLVMTFADCRFTIIGPPPRSRALVPVGLGVPLVLIFCRPH
jgi:hypothetical protein